MTASRGLTQDFNGLSLREHSTAASPCGGRLGGGPTARFYDAGLGRFIQPDTIIPNAADPQGWNRYAYVRGNPILFNDPSGHKIDEGCGSGQSCELPPSKPDDVSEADEWNRHALGEAGRAATTHDCLPGETCWGIPENWDLNPSHPDYRAVAISFFFYTFEYTQDRYGQSYVSPLGITLGQRSVLPAGLVVADGYIGSAVDQHYADFAETERFLTGGAANIGGGIGAVGAGITLSPETWIREGFNSSDSPIAGEESTYWIPNVGVTFTWNIPTQPKWQPPDIIP